MCRSHASPTPRRPTTRPASGRSRPAAVVIARRRIDARDTSPLRLLDHTTQADSGAMVDRPRAEADCSHGGPDERRARDRHGAGPLATQIEPKPRRRPGSRADGRAMRTAPIATGIRGDHAGCGARRPSTRGRCTTVTDAPGDSRRPSRSTAPSTGRASTSSTDGCDQVRRTTVTKRRPSRRRRCRATKPQPSTPRSR